MVSFFYIEPLSARRQPRAELSKAGRACALEAANRLARLEGRSAKRTSIDKRTTGQPYVRGVQIHISISHVQSAAAGLAASSDS